MTNRPSDTSSPYLAHYKDRVDHFLETHLPHPTSRHPELNRLRSAMRYTTQGPGKRARAVLCYATTAYLGCDLACVDPLAGALECLHAYTLIHDDLPAIDNDDWRRGRPSCHKTFDEPTALLAGDALQALAFEWIAENPALSSTLRLTQISCLARAVGHAGAVGGQILDLAFTRSGSRDPDALATLQDLKTGALFQCAIDAVRCLVPNTPEMDPLHTMGLLLGQAFQLQDDLQDQDGGATHLRAHTEQKLQSIYGLLSDKLYHLGPRSAPLAALVDRLLPRRLCTPS